MHGSHYEDNIKGHCEYGGQHTFHAWIRIFRVEMDFAVPHFVVSTETEATAANCNSLCLGEGEMISIDTFVIRVE